MPPASPPNRPRSGPPSAPATDSDTRDPRSSDVDVVIVNWNTRDLLRACLGSLLEGGHERLRRIIVVDNASADSSAEMVAAEFAQVELRLPGRNTGYAAGNNLGLASAEARYVLLLNPDTEVRAGSLDRLARFLDECSCCGVVAPQLVSPDGTVQRSCRSFPTPAALFAELLGLSRLWKLAPTLGAYRMLDWNHSTERAVDQPMGSALLVRRQVVDQVGGMDEGFPLFFNEVDWLNRIRSAGWEIWFTPSAQVLHHLGGSTRQIRLKAAWVSHTGLHAYYQKHYRRSLNPLLYGVIIAAIYLHALLLITLRAAQQLGGRPGRQKPGGKE